MSWHKEFLSENQNKNVLSNKSGLFKLIEEVYSEKLTKKEKSLISEDFIQNTLFEIFSGIDYSKITRKPLTDNKDYKTLLKEQEEPSVEEIKLGLPKLRISEEWGKPDSSDRQIIQRFERYKSSLREFR